MAYQDYSTSPADNTALGDGTYIGPNMLRTKVRPALQQLAADGKGLYDYVTSAITGINTGSVADLLLRPDLSAVGGAALIGRSSGGTVESGIFQAGRVTAIAGSKMKVERLIEDTQGGSFKLEDEAGIWGGKVETFTGLNKRFVAGDGQAGSPSTAFFTRAENDGSTGDVCALVAVAVANQSTGGVFGANIIARNTVTDGGASKLVGIEVDWEDADASAENPNSGLAFFNSFNSACPVGIQFGGVGGGSFTNGIIYTAAVSGTGLGASAVAMGSLVNSGSATYSDSAIVLSNGHRLRLSGTASTHAFIYNDSSNNVRIVNGAGALVIRNAGDTASVTTIDNGGNINLSGVYRVAGTQVVGPRQTGAASVATDLASVIALANDLRAKLISHGLIS